MTEFLGMFAFIINDLFSEKIKFDLSDFECYAQNQSNSCTIPVVTDVN